ncbi:hypothetical protein ACGFY0_45165 [Streptomyces chartreusis]|uniref:hypothetical protein n=1 Tax=Streptomyces chartreusis TaxID=1969 RepID=UPI00372194E5
MRRTTTAFIATGLLLALTSCGIADNPPAPPSDKGGAEASTSSPSTKTYTFQDCVALLDYDFQQGQPQDASKAPECAHLSPSDYQRAVGEVLTKRKDEIINPTSTP